MTDNLQKFRLLLVLLSSLFVYSFSFAAADLVVIQGDFAPKSISKNQNITASIVVKNIGDLPSDINFGNLIISDESNFLNATVLSRVALKKLLPNQTTVIEFVYPIPNTLGASNYYLATVLDIYDNVVENNEKNNFIFSQTLNVGTDVLGSLKTPYPFIFIHGLAGDGATWDTFTDDLDEYYGWNFGGQMNFCLNADGNNFTSNLATDYKNFNNPINLGDYYYINFAVDANGTVYKADSKKTKDIQSNQSAIFKQGKAVKDAIKKILAITGSDKVILVGHSMGGLAAREYLQNVSNWQSDGSHHVAKLLTIGTPHGGSNTTSLGVNIFDYLDEKSEAVRDLRYPFVPFSGRYLFGGIESTSLLFSSDDVNCNGYVGDNVAGLNQKQLPKNVSYSCIIGRSSALGGDGVVDDKRANLNTYPFNSGIVADTFVDRVGPASAFTQHTELHTRLPNIIKGMDEPLLFRDAYSLTNNKLYYGFTTIQSENAAYEWDYDDYKIEVLKKGNLRLQFWDIPIHEFEIDVYNSSLQKVCRTIVSNSRSNIDTTINNLPPDTYYIEVAGNPTPLSYLYPYAYKVNFATSTTPTDELTASKVLIYPNPASDFVTINTESTPSVSSIEIRDMLGRVYTKLPHIHTYIHEVSTATLPNGVYFIVVYGEDGQLLGSQKLMINK
jgi:triacylglycerol esterase/lipase EstA (alpha/beta hydrolase family)